MSGGGESAVHPTNNAAIVTPRPAPGCAIQRTIPQRLGLSNGARWLGVIYALDESERVNAFETEGA